MRTGSPPDCGAHGDLLTRAFTASCATARRRSVENRGRHTRCLVDSRIPRSQPLRATLGTARLRFVPLRAVYYALFFATTFTRSSRRPPSLIQATRHGRTFAASAYEPVRPSSQITPLEFANPSRSLSTCLIVLRNLANPGGEKKSSRALTVIPFGRPA